MSLDWDTGTGGGDDRCNANWCSNYAPEGRSLCDACARNPGELTAAEEIIVEVCSSAGVPLCIEELMRLTGFEEGQTRDAVGSLRDWDIICDDGGSVIGLEAGRGTQASLGEWAEQRGD